AARTTARSRERRAANGTAGAPSGGPLVDRVHRVRGGGAGGVAPPWRRGDRRTAGGVAKCEPLAFGVVVTELVAVAVADDRPADTHTDRGGAKPDARPDRDAAPGDSGANGRALRAGQLSAASDEDALTTGGPRSADRVRPGRR